MMLFFPPLSTIKPLSYSAIISIPKLITICLTFFCLLFLNSCAVNPPPLEFAPNPNIIEKALMLQLKQKYQYLSQQLETQPPEITIKQINIRKIEPIIEFNLPTYRLKGRYNLSLKTKNKKAKQIKNTFQIDLQRQKQGKTWRLIIPNSNTKSPQYFSYQIN